MIELDELKHSFCCFLFSSVVFQFNPFAHTGLLFAGDWKREKMRGKLNSIVVNNSGIISSKALCLDQKWRSQMVCFHFAVLFRKWRNFSSLFGNLRDHKGEWRVWVNIMLTSLRLACNKKDFRWMMNSFLTVCLQDWSITINNLAHEVDLIFHREFLCSVLTCWQDWMRGEIFSFSFICPSYCPSVFLVSHVISFSCELLSPNYIESQSRCDFFTQSNHRMGYSVLWQWKNGTQQLQILALLFIWELVKMNADSQSFLLWMPFVFFWSLVFHCGLFLRIVVIHKWNNCSLSSLTLFIPKKEPWMGIGPTYFREHSQYSSRVID